VESFWTDEAVSGMLVVYEDWDAFYSEFSEGDCTVASLVVKDFARGNVDVEEKVWEFFSFEYLSFSPLNTATVDRRVWD